MIVCSTVIEKWGMSIHSTVLEKWGMSVLLHPKFGCTFSHEIERKRDRESLTIHSIMFYVPYYSNSNCGRIVHWLWTERNSTWIKCILKWSSNCNSARFLLKSTLMWDQNLKSYSKSTSDYGVDFLFFYLSWSCWSNMILWIYRLNQTSKSSLMNKIYMNQLGKGSI